MNETTKDLSSLLITLRENLPELKEKYQIQTLEVFGSYVRAEQGQTSDLDILVTFSELPGLFKFIELENHLSDLLGVHVDLVLREALKPAIGEQILREAVSV